MTKGQGVSSISSASRKNVECATSFEMIGVGRPKLVVVCMGLCWTHSYCSSLDERNEARGRSVCARCCRTCRIPLRKLSQYQVAERRAVSCMRSIGPVQSACRTHTIHCQIDLAATRSAVEQLIFTSPRGGEPQPRRCGRQQAQEVVSSRAQIDYNMLWHVFLHSNYQRLQIYS